MIAAPRSALTLMGRRLVHRSVATPAMFKLRNILQEYNQANFNQGLPSSFVAKVYTQTDENEEGLVSALAVEHTLRHLSPDPTHELTPEDSAEILLKELGVRDFEHESLPMEEVFRLFFNNVEKGKGNPMTM